MELSKLTEKEIEKNKNLLVQPKMRFKARTDLERIFDVISQNSFGKMSKNVLNNNLKKLDPDILRKQELLIRRLQENIDPDFNKLGIKLEKKKKLKLMEPRQNIIQPKLNHVDNTSATMLMKELYNKTHFKAASSFSLFHPDVQTQKNIDLKNFFKKMDKVKDSNDDFLIDNETDSEYQDEEEVEINEMNISRFNKVNIFYNKSSNEDRIHNLQN